MRLRTVADFGGSRVKVMGGEEEMRRRGFKGVEGEVF